MAKPKIELDSNAFAPLEKSLGDAEALLQNKNQMYMEICRELTPTVQGWLLANYRASGLDFISGELQNMINNSELFPTRDGFVIRMKPGLKPEMYAKAGALQYGSVRDSDLSATSKKKIKKAGGLKGTTTTKAWDYYKLTPGQVAQLQTLINQKVQERMNRVMGAKK